LIPPADGLNEKQFGMLCKIIEDCSDRGFVVYTKVNRNMFKDLELFGVIGVATVTYSHWGGSYSHPHAPRDGFHVWITDIGHQYMRGEINVQKPCNMEGEWKYGISAPYGVCKRHNKRHTKEEVEEYVRTR
jgi:hypothetical protein